MGRWETRPTVLFSESVTKAIHSSEPAGPSASSSCWKITCGSPTTSTVVGDFGCTSRQAGIRCYYLPSPHGFWLSRDQPALF